MSTYRFRLTSGATLDLRCGDERDQVAVRVVDEASGATARAEPTILFYQQRLDPAGYRTLCSGEGVEALAARYMARQADRFGRVGSALGERSRSGAAPGARSATGSAP